MLVHTSNLSDICEVKLPFSHNSSPQRLILFKLLVNEDRSFLLTMSGNGQEWQIAACKSHLIIMNLYFKVQAFRWKCVEDLVF